MGRGPVVCTGCYRHVCLKCGWYRVLSRGVETEACCFRCATPVNVEMREVAHTGWNKCPFIETGLQRAKMSCQFCERDRPLRYLVEADGGYECRDAVRCEAYSRRNGDKADV
ncbi:hypothetical protein SEA_DRYAD_3 [Streptomyces phage Dryad]|nr:hypothetical protein SEA_DRYAD_3 [Streptomyces phage Dryad]